MSLIDERKAVRNAQPITRLDFHTAFQSVVRMVRASHFELKQMKDAHNAKIEARLAQLKDGKTPTKEELAAIIKPLLPVQPRDGETPSDEKLRSLIRPLIPAPMNGRDGKDAANVDQEAIIARIKRDLPKTGAAIRDGLELLMGEDRIKATAIHGLDEIIAAFFNKSNQGYGPGGGTSFALLQSGTEKVQQPLALNFTGAGAPTITHKQSGVTDISFPASTGGTPVYNEVVSGSGTSFTLANTPTAGSVRLYAQGQRLVPTTNYSISGANITTTDSWSVGALTADYSK